MLSVSVVLLILLSTAFVCDADSEDISCVKVENTLDSPVLDHIQLSFKSDIPKKPISGKVTAYSKTCYCEPLHVTDEIVN